MNSNIRQRSEQFEEQYLSQRATLSGHSLGRKTPEEECTIRTAFMRDRDRIIHCKSFRRLKHKTQVFLSPEGDHYRTRLTHTLEVSQIARTIARALRLNEDLTEAVALGHDLGHTPFGHAGERAIREICGSFNHYEQSVRVCELIEKDGQGLNLTLEVLDGILHHTSGEQARTLEGRIVRISDRIAYINHDIEDAIRASVLANEDIPIEIRNVLGHTKSERINKMVMSVLENSEDDIAMDEKTFKCFNELHSFLYEHVYYNPTCKREEEKVMGIIEGLFEYFYKKHPEKLPSEYMKIAEQEGLLRAVTDHIAGMTDRYAVQLFSEIYLPKSWNI